MSGTSSSILVPLNLSVETKALENNEEFLISCLFCDETYKFPLQKDDLLAHLYIVHRVVISDVPEIAILEDYLRFWKKKFNGVNIQEYCTTLLLDQLPDGTRSENETYYLLSDVLPADYEIRQNLKVKKMELVLKIHQFERTDKNFSRLCLYCRNIIEPTRADFLEHLFSKHFLHLGKPQNLVFIDEFINLVQDKMEKLICIFCEKVFKDRTTLKEHMRKKGHKRINPDNKTYDKYYLINYKNDSKTKVITEKSQLDTTTNNIQVKSERTVNKTKIVNDENGGVFQTEYDSDSDWSDWVEGEEQQLTCLFCVFNEINIDKLKCHMLDKHEFNFDILMDPLNFYQKIKIINYIRRQMHMLRCVTCNQQFTIITDLQEHMNKLKHIGIGEKSNWDQAEFFFPTYEDDGLLCHLEDNSKMDENIDDDNLSEDSAIVYSEDPYVLSGVNSDAENLSIENFKNILN